MPARDGEPAARDQIDKFAARLGVSDSYADQSNMRVPIARDTQLALMEALGFPAGSHTQLRDSQERFDEQCGALVPQWMVVNAGEASLLGLPKPLNAAHWRIKGENGFHAERGAKAGPGIPALEPGYYHLEFDGRTSRTLLIVAPRKCWTPPELASGTARGWGLTAQVYGLRSARNFGFGDFTDIANLAKAAGRRGASFLGLSPLHALFSSDRSKISPYSPSTRLFIEPLYLDPDLIGAGGDAHDLQARLERLRIAPLVDYRETWDVKRALLERLFTSFSLSGGSASLPHRSAALGEALHRHATFEALSEHFLAQGQNWAGVWPEAYFDSSSPAVARFSRDHADRIAFHTWLQARCDEQLARAARAHGMEVGLYRDLAVGADRYGSEVWARPDRYAMTLSVGAPPDPLGPQGQNWGFPPFNPITLQAQDFAAFRDLVAANMRHAGAIRIDHAFQLQRLFLIPPGATAAQGGYVQFPFEALLAILRLESQRNRCMVIAEDLGTGPKDFSDAIMRSGLLSYRVLSFERTDDGGFVPPRDYPRAALAAITTHDLPTFKGWRRGFDIDLRSHFGVYSEPQARHEHLGRARDVAHWQDALRREGLRADIGQDSVARDDALTYLARSPSVLLAAQIEDLLDEINQANLPGLSEGPPNWRRRMSGTIEDFIAGNGPLGKTGALMAAEGRTLRPRQARLAADPPRATYRLQFHAGFTFEAARKILPYLKKLGVSHVYASPIQKARRESTHGYDVVDPRDINPELGGRTGFDAFEQDLHALGLKLILDIVPNHMGIGAENPFWNSVLQWGERSPYASVFDIDFPRGDGKVILPILGMPYGRALEAGEFRLAFRPQRGFLLCYFDRAFPVSPCSYAGLLGRPSDKGFDQPDTFDAALASLVSEVDESVLAAVCEKTSADRDALDALMREQFYRLAPWRLAGSQINYRRFFEINSLAGVRIEDEQVFELTHRLIFELVDRGQIDGLRIDHVDGLADPKAYLERLQRRVGPGFYIVVEKILERGERLKNWPVSGSTGYDALNELDGVLVERKAHQSFDLFYRDTVGETERFAEALDASKALVLECSFGAEIEHLADELFRVARLDPQTTDISQASLRRVVQQAVVAWPVYRTYVASEGADEADRELIERVVQRVRADACACDRAATDILRHVLCAAINPPQAARLRRAFEQLTGPVMAKGLEDTLFYRHAPLLALNEVGANPSCFGMTKEAFDKAAAARARDWPSSLIATATHDTKRGEDARARLLAITAAPDVFFMEAERFLACAQGPDRNDAFILLQALVASWPVENAFQDNEFKERARGFYLKAIREAKRRSSWTDPNEAYEARALALIDACLTEGPLRQALSSLAARFAWPGALNGLARTILKLTLPGVPDFYQGAELWDFSFVDPDNRRPVDFNLRSAFLESSDAQGPQALLANWRDGRIKQWLITRLLAEREATPDLFAFGDYEPRAWEAGIAFQRREQESKLFVCIPTGTQLLARGCGGPEDIRDPEALWRKEKLALEAGRWRNLLTGSAFVVEGAVACAELADGLPWIILGKMA